MLEEDDVQRVASVTVGENLTSLSIEELEERIAALSAEIKRSEGELASKRSSLAAADAVFSKR
ncbi:MAG: DUF1192 domain-containing protein [Maricaulaceae bacterium]